MMIEAVPVILVGFGWWARNRTVIPLLEQEPNLLEVVAVTSLKGGEEEFRTLVEPEINLRGWDVPSFVEELSDAVNGVGMNTKPLAAVVNTPHGLHFTQTKIALEAGLHVYVEGTVVRPNDDLSYLIQLAEQKKKLLFNGLQRRLEETYTYLYQVVANHYNFNQLTSIRCFLSSGRQLKGWRRSQDLAGGGILCSDGHHLLDGAAWIASAAGIEIPDHLSGAVLLEIEEKPPENILPLEVETTAVGYINLPKGILLSFDLSYHVPVDSIYERLEIRDNEGARVTLTRNQSKRSTEPATITHQRPDGSLVEAKALSDFKMRMDEIRFSGTANNTGPLRSFLQKIQKEETDMKDMAVCDARLSLSTWRLIRGIYRLANNKYAGGDYDD